MADNEFQSTVESLFQGMNQFVSPSLSVQALRPVLLKTAITQAAVWAVRSTRAPCS